MKKLFVNLGAGIVVLGTAFVLLPTVLMGLFRLTLSIPAILFLWAPFYRAGGPANFIWAAILVAMALFGLIRQKPGYAIAPIAFAALWFLVSVGSRAFVEFEATGVEWQPAVPAAATGYRSLIVDGWWELQHKLVADGVVDRMVQVSRNHNSKRSSRYGRPRLPAATNVPPRSCVLQVVSQTSAGPTNATRGAVWIAFRTVWSSPMATRDMTSITSMGRSAAAITAE